MWIFIKDFLVAPYSVNFHSLPILKLHKGTDSLTVLKGQITNRSTSPSLKNSIEDHAGGMHVRKFRFRCETVILKVFTIGECFLNDIVNIDTPLVPSLLLLFPQLLVSLPHSRLEEIGGLIFPASSFRRPIELLLSNWSDFFMRIGVLIGLVLLAGGS